ncbi:Ferrous iron transport protein A [Tenacibaculum finnmarkense genomovar ulcerans]|uniref:Ferrous iron transport protein A n=1 Tax=Tenacibaculum finnmarkense genomovar ulcerans TaxID=2781388 RepID=A0A2I2LCZ6_9FLAO|nr:Ferrous iron transport protein A [Tenacibaculum dicentrarchi]SOS58060.1 Ferrous iron transport protein A [Tenacibaculum finnmarkense genomovar ulcerans]
MLVNIIRIILSSIASLQIGESGIISEESLDVIPLKLLEMGCLPGTEVELLQIAPLKDPIYICVNGSHLAIRKEMASQILITKI